MKKFKTFTRKYLCLPYGIFMFVFIVMPLIILLLYAFSVKDGTGGLSFEFTFDNFASVFKSDNLAMLGRSLLIGLITTLICLIIGYPVAYLLADKKLRFGPTIVMLFMIPMWVNFLLRTLATKAMFEFIGIEMGMGTVIFGMVYNYLPFMIMPIYTTISKIDYSLVEGAADLGANSAVTFTKVIFPLSIPGVLSGITMVFTPTITTFAISKLLSGSKISLIGDYIDLQVEYMNYNVAAAISLVIVVIVGISMLVVNKYDKDNSTMGGGLW
ncbi:MAG: ABC transporter permease [Clostridia bacterium]|nr:ABC transporter permease [Clostridia bacterium]